MRFSLAWRNMVHNRVRTLVMLAGMGFSILLLFMQIGFYNACKLNSTMIYDMFQFDAVLLAPNYVFIDDAGDMPLRRAKTALSVPGVRSAIPLFMSAAQLRHPVTGEKKDIFAMGVDIEAAPFKNRLTNKSLGVLKAEDSGLIDRKSTLDYGPLPIGASTELNGKRIRILGDFSNGAGFISGGSVIVSDLTFSRALGVSTKRPNAVLIRFTPGGDHQAALSGLRAALSGDVQVLTLKDLKERERHFFMSVNPIGVMFSSGAVIAFLVGAVILYQILSSEVLHHLREYATLKAMGYTGQDLKMVVMAQGLLMTAAAFIPSTGLASLVYRMLRSTVQIPVYMTPELLVFIFTASLAMSGVSGLLAVRRIQAADPAELF